MCKLGGSIRKLHKPYFFFKHIQKLQTVAYIWLGSFLLAVTFVNLILLNKHSKIVNLEKYLLGGWKGQVHDVSHFITPSSLLGVLYQLYCEASFLKCVMLICVKNCKKSPAKLFMVKMKPFNLNKDHLRLIHYAVMAIPCSSKHLVL